MAIRRSRERRPSVMDVVDGVLFAFAGLATVWLAYLVLREGVQPGWPMLLLVVFWVLLTYLLLPRLHRILTRVYVPGYFIGRARTSDGLLGDPVNLALRGQEAQVHAAMTRAGWTRADDLSMRSGMRILRSTLSRRSYDEAPVSPLNLFDRQQDFAYQQEVEGSPSKRHHVRFWRCPEGWMLPGGYAVDWLAAGTYDKSVGLSLFTLQVTHKIEENTDIERDYIVKTVSAATPEVAVEVIENFSTGYHSRNGGGDLIITDGDLPIIDVRRVEVAEIAKIEYTDSRDKRPAQIVFGAGVALFRGLFFLPIALILLLLPAQYLQGNVDLQGVTVEGGRAAVIVAGSVIAFIGLIDIGLATAVFVGRNWARILLMLSCVVTTIGAFIGNANGSEVITLATSLPTVGISIMVLLALSSHRAREYAARRRHVPKRIA
ncbi:MAG TPA: LssY C-terminal domain-containing protein, partial [Propionibacteriaceae bacterium]|nr:LssY C-terminal domain-containing protein [Propionibacteriaceae bacterium]